MICPECREDHLEDPDPEPPKHTPGPWDVDQDGVTIIHHETITYVADLRLGGDSGDVFDDEARANARLIAAAPAFAKAWVMVPEEIKQRIFDALHCPDTEWVESAIAKAEGRNA